MKNPDEFTLRRFLTRRKPTNKGGDEDFVIFECLILTRHSDGRYMPTSDYAPAQRRAEELAGLGAPLWLMGLTPEGVWSTYAENDEARRAHLRIVIHDADNAMTVKSARGVSLYG